MESIISSSFDEYILNWLVESVDNIWTPREVPVGLFPAFEEMLHDIIVGVTESGWSALVSISCNLQDCGAMFAPEPFIFFEDGIYVGPLV